jgi:hypothetical protein
MMSGVKLKLFPRVLIALLAVAGVLALASGSYSRYLGDLKLGKDDFWDYHGFLYLAAVTVFPRLTLLFTTVVAGASGGLLWWAGWLLAPRVLVAVLATIAYWNQNPILVVIAWLVAFGGESSEKYVVIRRSRPRRARSRPGYESARWVDAEVRKRD